MKICHFNTLFGAHQVEDVFFFLKFSKLIVSIFELFQSSELIKYVFLIILNTHI
jgi:hypothetical protein